MIGKRLLDIWYGERAPGVLLRSLEQIYRRISARRQSRGQAHPGLIGKPIVVVGNITAGGTGKTPLVMRLADLLAAAGRSVAVISRGYGRQSRGPVHVTSGTPPEQGGDEPVLIARRSGVPVYVDADREQAALLAFEQGAEVVLADDGLQRPSLPRMMELCVVDGARGFGNGHLMPAGPLREPLARLGSVDSVIINGSGSVPEAPADAVVMTLLPTALVSVNGGKRLALAEALKLPEFAQVIALAGTGNPQRFFDTLRAAGIRTSAETAFADHHAFEPGDFAELNGTIIMTEKDAVKCTHFDLPSAWYLEVEARLPASWEDGFMRKLEQFLMHENT